MILQITQLGLAIVVLVYAIMLYRNFQKYARLNKEYRTILENEIAILRDFIDSKIDKGRK